MSDEAIRYTSADDPLPVHAPGCFGCGGQNPCGLRLKAWRDGQDIRGTVTFAEHHSGAPAYAHGGAVATAIDDCLGYLMYLAQQPAVTAKLELNYRRPVLLNVRYELHAWMVALEGRKIRTAIEMRDPSGELAAEATGLFIIVSVAHFTKDLPPDWREKAQKLGLELPW